MSNTTTVAPNPMRSAFDPLVQALGSRIAAEQEVEPFRRDPEYVARMLPMLRRMNAYFGSEVRGLDNLPAEGPMLIVGNHSGGMYTMDILPLWLRWLETRGAEAPLYALGFDLLFAMPGIRDSLRRLGVLPASPENGIRALEEGNSVAVFPGGDYEVFRPWTQRNIVDFGGRTGFITLAIAMGVPVVPMTIHGAHDTTIVWSRGDRLAKNLGLDRIRVKVMPTVFSFPFGLQPGWGPAVPLPSKVTVQLSPPIDWSHHSPKHAEDPAVLQACYEEIIAVMQGNLSDMARERPFPVLSRLNELRPSRRWRRRPRLSLVQD